jgi:hypothetical protein
VYCDEDVAFKILETTISRFFLMYSHCYDQGFEWKYSYGGDCTDGVSSVVGCRTRFWVLTKAVTLKALATSRNLTAGTGYENLALSSKKF